MKLSEEERHYIVTGVSQDEKSTDVSSPHDTPPIKAIDVYHRFEFRGDPKDYFGIWIVNIVLSILTLSFYMPWAKVRRKKFFLGNTYVNGHSFDYHATPKQLLLGHFLAVFFIAAYFIFEHFLENLGIFLLLILFPLWPIIINKSLRFNARMTSYKNVRFDFKGSYWKSFWVGLMSVGGATGAGPVGIPLATSMSHAYLGDNYCFGGKTFSNNNCIKGLHKNYKHIAKPQHRMFTLYIGYFFKAIFNSIWLFMAIYIISLAVQAPFTTNPIDILETGNQGQLSASAEIFKILAIILPIVYGWQYYKVRTKNYFISKLELQPFVSFISTMKPRRATVIIFTNLLVNMCTAMLARPWAACRLYKYKVESLTLKTKYGYDELFHSHKTDATGATADMFASETDIGIGF